jgi:membrane-bound serine protease (ClpP class)
MVGIVCIFSALLLALVGNIRFSFENLPPTELFRALMIVLGGMGMGAGLIIYLSSRIGRPGFLNHAALHADQEGFVSVSMAPMMMVGKTGVAATVLRPSGRVMLEGEHYDAISMKGFIEQGDEVIVKRFENFQLYVVKK